MLEVCERVEGSECGRCCCAGGAAAGAAADERGAAGGCGARVQPLPGHPAQLPAGGRQLGASWRAGHPHRADGARDRGRPPACGRPQVCSCAPVVYASLLVCKHTNSSAMHADQPCIREGWRQLQHAQRASPAYPGACGALQPRRMRR